MADQDSHDRLERRIASAVLAGLLTTGAGYTLLVHFRPATADQVAARLQAAGILRGPAPPAAQSAEPTPATDPARAAPAVARGPHDWPFPVGAHPMAATFDGVNDPFAIGRAIRKQEPDPWTRAVIAHDVVARRVEYDTAAFDTGRIPRQDARTVLRTGRSVCAGYANLFDAVAKAAGLESAVITGRAFGAWSKRDSDKYAAKHGHPPTGTSLGLHAWNAVRLDGDWRLLDVTWDDGGATTDYLFAPAEVMALEHWPTARRWQAGLAMKNLAEFKAQAPLTPRGVGFGIRVASPQARALPAGPHAVIVLDNPLGRSVMVEVENGGKKSAAGRCAVDPGVQTLIRCDALGPTDEVELFAAEGADLSYAHIATFTVEDAPAADAVADARVGGKR